MPKAEAGSVKDIAKRIKAKGLQKLKFYCQMCEKQCRDANGFKCHIQSESHLRQMKLFSENASGIMNQYSREFETVFLDTLRMFHSTVQVNANQVYQQVIRDKSHIHMNATIWATLTDFCKYLGRTGKAKVEETERGWYITYINRNVDQIIREQQAEQRLQAEQQAEADLQKRMEERRKEASLAMEKAGFQKQDVTNLEPRAEDETIQIALPSAANNNSNGGKKPKKKHAVVKNVLAVESDDEENDVKEPAKETSHFPELPNHGTRASFANSHMPPKRPREADLSHDEKQPKKRHITSSSQTAPSVWLYRDTVVRIVDKEFKRGRYFRRKAYVDRVIVDDDGTREGRSPAEAEVTLIPKEGDADEEGKDVVLRLPQDSLETVVPRPEGRVRILRGLHRGKKATVLSLNKKDYWARLELKGTVMERVDYEDISQLA